MRNQDEWVKREQQKIIDRFSPRIREVFKNIEYPKDIENQPVFSSYIWGKAGYGKTIYASCLLLEEERKLYLAGITGRKCLFISVPDLLMEIKSSYGPNAVEGSKTEFDIIKYYSDAWLLVLDDFGTVKPTDWVLQTLYLIVNRRYENLKTTIFTSNLSLSECASVLGDDRIVSRIQRMCEGNILCKSKQTFV